jgi:hypothetical protein
MRHAVILFGADRSAWCFDDQLDRLKKRISRAVENLVCQPSDTYQRLW